MFWSRLWDSSFYSKERNFRDLHLIYKIQYAWWNVKFVEKWHLRSIQKRKILIQFSISLKNRKYTSNFGFVSSVVFLPHFSWKRPISKGLKNTEKLKLCILSKIFFLLLLNFFTISVFKMIFEILCFFTFSLKPYSACGAVFKQN